MKAYVPAVNHTRVSDLLTDGCTSFSVPGAQVGLVRGDDRLVVCAGTRDLDARAPVDPGTMFHAGSLTKSLHPPGRRRGSAPRRGRSRPPM